MGRAWAWTELDKLGLGWVCAGLAWAGLGMYWAENGMGRVLLGWHEVG
jgi:hypothetical protein